MIYNIAKILATGTL